VHTAGTYYVYGVHWMHSYTVPMAFLRCFYGVFERHNLATRAVHPSGL
jgi:hypothetical protein